MTCTIDQMVAMCASQIGFKEGPNNDTKYGVWYGLNHGAYCDMGISWCADQLGASDIIGKFAYCPSHVNWFKARGQWVTTPRRGDIVFFSWDGGPIADHVGIVEVANSWPTTIEFNTSSGAAGSQSNGDGVYRRVRNPAYILGYGRPNYSDVPSTQPSSWDGASYPGAGAFVLGQSHPAVTKLGQMLVSHGFGGRYKSGPGPEFTEVDRLSTQDYQKSQGWSGGDADGYPGPTSWARLSGSATTPSAPAAPARPTVSVSHINTAAHRDRPAAQGHTTYRSEVLIVERALNAEGYLRGDLVDGSAGTSSFGQNSAYQRWQLRVLGAVGTRPGQAADGYPGVKTLTLLGNKHGFNVIA